MMINEPQNPFLAADYLEPKDRLKALVTQEVSGKPFSELSAVAFDHEGSTLAGHVLLDTLEESGLTLEDFDAVGALTAAAVPFAVAMLQAAVARGQQLDAFVMDFVFPGIKGPNIAGKKVVLLDAWLSEKSYIQTSSLVTLHKGNELNLDFGVLQKLGASVQAVAALIGSSPSGNSVQETGRTQEVTVVNPVDGSEQALPFIYAFDEKSVIAQ